MVWFYVGSAYEHCFMRRPKENKLRLHLLPNLERLSLVITYIKVFVIN